MRYLDVQLDVLVVRSSGLSQQELMEVPLEHPFLLLFPLGDMVVMVNP
jgi:hypothetical protein